MRNGGLLSLNPPLLLWGARGAGLDGRTPTRQHTLARKRDER